MMEIVAQSNIAGTALRLVVLFLDKALASVMSASYNTCLLIHKARAW